MDHERVNIRQTSMSCGVAELSRISDEIDGVLYALASRLYHPARGEPFTFFVFSDLAAKDMETNSSRLVAKVLDNDFGEIGFSDAFENPKTGNSIVLYSWGINHEVFKKWYSEERVKKLKKVGT